MNRYLPYLLAAYAFVRRHLPYVVAALALLVVLGSFFKKYPSDGFDLDAFAALPAQNAGRIQPLDTVARNNLRLLSSRTEVQHDDEKIPAIRWLLDLTARPEVADTWPVFRIDHPDVLGLLNLEPNDKYYSFERLEPSLAAVEEAAQKIFQREQAQGTSASERTKYEAALVTLYGNILRYSRLGQAFHPMGGLDSLPIEYGMWEGVAVSVIEEIRKREAGLEFDERVFNQFTLLASRYEQNKNVSFIGIAPPPETAEEGAQWLNVGELLLDTVRTGNVPEIAMAHAKLCVAWRQNNPDAFNEAVASLAKATASPDADKAGAEAAFNQAGLFYTCILLYIGAMLLYFYTFVMRNELLRRTATWIVIASLAVHTLGLLMRMWLQGYAPVTNLYSSAIFAGWGAVILGLVLERIFKDGIGGLVAAVVGFSTLILAYNLATFSNEADTLEPMRAVLNSNFWLATHVTIVTYGYSAMFIAGMIGIVYVIMRFIGRLPSGKDRSVIYKMVYGIVCFGLLFSFVGTMLGGIWADQSWGRFWGWDPKENGALLIVLWCALMLHARWGGLVKERGFMLLAIGGNIITSWSWFGTNMLGIGLHSYGFMDAAFVALSLFWLSQLAIIGLGFFPSMTAQRSASSGEEFAGRTGT